MMWRLVMAASTVIVWVLTPLSIALMWATKQARRIQDRADTELLYAAAHQRAARGRKGARP